MRARAYINVYNTLKSTLIHNENESFLTTATTTLHPPTDDAIVSVRSPLVSLTERSPRDCRCCYLFCYTVLCCYYSAITVQHTHMTTRRVHNCSLFPASPTFSLLHRVLVYARLYTDWDVFRVLNIYFIYSHLLTAT